MQRKTQGFTIVELLIVIVVIAILAAISIIVYNGIRNRANDTSVKSDLKNLSSRVQEYMTLHDETPPTADQAGLQALVKVAKSAYTPRSGTSLLYCRTNKEFGFVAESKSDNAFVIENGVLRSIGTWGGSNDNTACGSNATVGLIYGSEPGYGHIYLFRNSTWQTWVP